MLPRDLYGLPLTTNAAGAEFYNLALGRILRVQPGADAALRAAVRADPDFQHLRVYPRDAPMLSVAVPTIAFAGAAGVPARAWALVEELAPAYGNDWWYASLLAFVRQEQSRWAEAAVLADRALADGLAWLDGWIAGSGLDAGHRVHFSWHAALHELAEGDADAVRHRYATQLAPRTASGETVTGVRLLVDSASLLWRGSLDSVWLDGRFDTAVALLAGRVPDARACSAARWQACTKRSWRVRGAITPRTLQDPSMDRLSTAWLSTAADSVWRAGPSRPQAQLMFVDQAGVVTRTQALAAGTTLDAIRAHLRAGRWQPLFRSTYATFSGPVPRMGMLWSAVLAAGTGAALSHQSAGEVWGVIDDPQNPIHLVVPSRRRVTPIRGVVVHRSCRADLARHPSRTPPRTRVEETVVDLVDTAASLEQALGWITRACGRRLTRADRIAEVLAARTRVRWRSDVLAALRDVADGAQSPLELRYLRDVERAHRLPPGSRQHAIIRSGGRCYEDVRYPEFGVTVELDGQVAHPAEVSFRDMRRDNASVRAGCRVLRYGWADVAEQPCVVAAEVAAVLHAAGWPGAPRLCGSGCRALDDLGEFTAL